MAEQARSLPTASAMGLWGGVVAVQEVILPMVAAKGSGWQLMGQNQPRGQGALLRAKRVSLFSLLFQTGQVCVFKRSIQESMLFQTMWIITYVFL